MELENNGAGSEEYAVKLRESGLRLRESERTLGSTRQDLSAAHEMLNQATAQSSAMQQKYARAKRVARELRADITARDEFYEQLLQEKDTEYNALVKTLKDRVRFCFLIYLYFSYFYNSYFLLVILFILLLFIIYYYYQGIF